MAFAFERNNRDFKSLTKKYDEWDFFCDKSKDILKTVLFGREK